MRQLIQAAQKMHAAGVIHRDIKPENVLVSQSGALKVCDFGLATKLRPAGTPYDEGRVGTMIYNSPEQLAGKRSYGTAVDMWALGCVMAELLTGHRLFCENTIEGIMAKVHFLRDLLRDRGLQAFDVLRLRQFSPAGREVLAGLLAFDPEDRLTAEAALQHRWFKEGLDLTLSL
ncbi:putative cyclin-dependent kinase F-2 [Lolium rigidum]|uniref:putative cyclin-dependent kinase F-2 n=1 Tax=Lolium rigidum TaxID=89674 RepID=UPI001F5D11CE|nr:putative cyclin-dependent kinase F-2 [Lolium rigidum]